MSGAQAPLPSRTVSEPTEQHHPERHQPEHHHPDGYTISTDPARVDRKAVWAFLRTSYWSPGIALDVSHGPPAPARPR